jgi:cell wall-associated NlpC family hydrolase
MKKLLFSAVLVLLGSFGLRAQVHKDSATPTYMCDSIACYAQTFLGTPYKYGCASTAGFDCSGFTWYVFSHFGYTIPRSSKDYLTLGKDVSIAEARKGDIIVFTGTHAGDKRAGHVGIVISNPGEPLRFIHSSSSSNHRGVVITDYAGSAYPKRFIRICRVL